MKRAKSVSEIQASEYEYFDFDGDWEAAFDKPEACGTWFIWGKSANGKGNASYMLAKYLTNFGRVLVNDFEEHDRASQKKTLNRLNMAEVKSKIKFVKEPMCDLVERLKKPKAPKIVFINSWQYAEITFSAFKKITEQFPKVLFVIISQAKDNGSPIGDSALRVMYHADLKVYVEGHRAISKGRYIGRKGYINTWLEGALKYWTTA